MLVEARWLKNPIQSDLGTSLNVLDPFSGGNGHVPRNIRLSLAAVDLVEPYLSVVGVNNIILVNDIVPLMRRSCNSIPVVAIPPNLNQLTLKWTVGGSMTIDETRVWVAKASNVKAESVLHNCTGTTQPDATDIIGVFEASNTSQSGSGFFSVPQGARPSGSSGTNNEIGPIFSSVIDVADINHDLMIVVSAPVDSSWTKQPYNSAPSDTRPQVHVVNARTNPDWYHESASKIVEGRLAWFSLPIKIVRGTASSVTTVELNSQFNPVSVPTFAPVPIPMPTLSTMPIAPTVLRHQLPKPCTSTIISNV